jgi:hypothetical protein
MSAKYVALIVAAVVLSACETTSVTDAGPSPKKRIVVRGEVVPDEPIKSKKVAVKKAAAVRTARAVAPVVPAGEMAPVIDATPGASSGSSGGTGASTGEGASTGSDVGTAPGADTSALADASATVPGSDVTATPLAPVEPTTLSAEPVSTTTPTPSPFAIDFRDMLNATVAGFPLWLMVVVGIVLAGALVFGTGGRREPREERDYEPRPYPERESRYDEARYEDEPHDAEPQPA